MDSEEASVLCGPLQTVSLSSLIQNISEQAKDGVKHVLELDEDVPDEQK